MLIAYTKETSGLTRLTFELSSDAVMSKNIVFQINSLNFLLPVEAVEKAGGFSLAYDAGSLISLSKYLRQNKVGKPIVIKILREICSAIILAKENGLYAENFSFDADHVFIDTHNMELKMTLFPFETGQQTITKLKALLSKLIDELMVFDNDDTEYIAIIRNCYKQPNFAVPSLVSVLDELESNCEETRGSKNYRRQKKEGIRICRRFFGKRDEPIVQLPPVDEKISTSSATVLPQKINSGTELILPFDETVNQPPEQKKSVWLSITIGGVSRETEITVFPCVLGRSPQEADIVLEESSVSRKHAIIDWVEDGFVIIDNDATNRTIHNGLKLQPHDKQLIAAGDSIKIGRVEITVDGIDVE